LWFTVVLLLLVAAWVGPASVTENAPAYVFILSTLAMTAVLYLGYASFFVLKQVCVFCVATYAAVTGLFVISGGATPFPLASVPRRLKRDLRTLTASPVALAAAIMVVGGAASVPAFFPREARPSQAAPAATLQADKRTEFERWWSSLPRTPVMVPAENAAVVVVKFNDYQCPPCRQTYFEYKSVIAKYRSQTVNGRPALAYVSVDFPLDDECNPGVRLHESACEAAAAVRLARQRNRAEQMEEWLFTNQASLTPASVRRAAQEVGGVPDFDAKYSATLELVRGDIALGKQLRVTGTPTFFINGVRAPGLQAAAFDAAIAYELKRAQPPAQ
jgi:protein-disulfide isomerase